MTTINEPAVSGTVNEIALNKNSANKYLRKFDQATGKVADWLNPILIKEARQALKSKQFVLTFSLLLIAAWSWTAIAILMMMPRIYFVPSGAMFLGGYYLVLAVPMLLVVPLAAHRSLASEVDDGTLDLLSVTNLSPMQIITGKLASAALQIMLYLVALFPCVAFCYVLRGVDLLTIAGLLSLTMGTGLILTVAGLFFASLPTAKGGQLGMLVLMLLIIVITQFSVASLAFYLVDNGFGDSITEFTAFVLLFASFIITLSFVLLRAAAAQLSPPSENRATPIRIALVSHQLAVFALISYALMTFGNVPILIQYSILYMAVFWMLMGTLMVGESPVLTPRIRRDLPATFLGRSLAAWFIPGPSTGLVFSIGCFIAFCVSLLTLMFLAELRTPTQFTIADDQRTLMLTLLGYMMLLMASTRWCMALIRRYTSTQASVALAVLAIVAGLFALIPYSIQLHLYDYGQMPWSVWQITNWAWTLGLAVPGFLDDRAPYLIFAIGGIVWLVSLMFTGRIVLPLTVATPQRVLEEQNKHKLDERLLEIDPLATTHS